MKNLILILILLVSGISADGQYDRRQFLDEQMAVVSSETDAKYYREYIADQSVGYHVKVFYLDGNIRMTGTYRDSEMMVENGHFTYYYHQGHAESEGYYKDGYKHGPWKRWTYRGEQRPDRFYPGITPEDIMASTESTAAVFPGGYEALASYISENLNYPEEARKQKIQGDVSIAFNISEEGEVCNVVVYESADYYLDKEALRLVYDMPSWTPATRGGQASVSKFILPLTFRIPEHGSSAQ